MKKSTWIILIMFVFILASCSSREERNQQAQEAGQAVTEEKASFVKGVGEGLKGVGKDAAETVTEGVGEVLKGGNEGLDKSLVKKEIRVSESLKGILTASRAEADMSDSAQNKKIVVYTIFEKDFNSKLVLKAFNKNNEEIGRSTTTLKETADNSRFVEFLFDKRTSFTLVQYLVLETKTK